tara:strand:+ start:580 stop:681 length:102 start_codon:yes stop_codon:yes gene_type:complete
MLSKEVAKIILDYINARMPLTQTSPLLAITARF